MTRVLILARVSAWRSYRAAAPSPCTPRRAMKYSPPCCSASPRAARKSRVAATILGIGEVQYLGFALLAIGA